MTISKPEEQQVSENFLRYLSMIDGDRTESGIWIFGSAGR